MKLLLILTTLCASLATAIAQEKLPAEKAQAIGHKLMESLGELSDPQVRIEPNADKGDAFAGEGGGAVIVPDKNLNSEMIEKAGGTVIPVGHLFLKALSPSLNGKVTPADKLRPVVITDQDGEHHVAVLLLGVRKLDGGLELVVYGKDREPLLQLPLRTADSTAQELPVELAGEKRDDDTGALKLSIFGKYKAAMLVKRAEG